MEGLELKVQTFLMLLKTNADRRPSLSSTLALIAKCCGLGSLPQRRSSGHHLCPWNPNFNPIIIIIILFVT